MIQEELKQTIEILKTVVCESELRVSDECIFIQACTFMRTPKESSNGNQGLEKATEKQIDFLCKLNADFDADKITKKEAKSLIDKLVKERGKKK